MKTFIILPTYNELENIGKICKEILNVDTDIELLVVDDNSPDGTYKIVEDLAKIEPRVHLLLRKTERGRGSAGIAGFKMALELGAEILMEMDADFSHQPKYIPKFLEEIQKYDVVIGSRYVNGGKDFNRGFIRQTISNFARYYLKIMLGIKVLDPTSGFRMFRKNVILKILPKLKANDPFIVTEALYYITKNGFKIKEIPIEFIDRQKGESKLGASILFKYLFKVLKLKINSF